MTDITSRILGDREQLDPRWAHRGRSGHGEPFKKDYLPVYTAYVKDFLAEVPQATDAGDLVNRVWRSHREWRTMAGLRFSANAHIDARKPKN